MQNILSLYEFITVSFLFYALVVFGHDGCCILLPWLNRHPGHWKVKS